MRLAGNEPALRRDLRPLVNRIDLREYPGALPVRPVQNFVDLLTCRRKNCDFARRSNVDPQSALLCA
jgi:molybdenum cofactor biosynthesis enzyme MoaA